MTEIKYFQMGEKDILSNITGNLSMIYCYFILCQFLMQRMIKNPIHYSQSSLFLCILSSNSPFSLQTHKSWPPEKNVLSSFMFTKHWENIKRCCLWAMPFSHFLHVQTMRIWIHGQNIVSVQTKLIILSLLISLFHLCFT